MELSTRMLRKILEWIDLSPGSGIDTERLTNRLGVEDSVASYHVCHLFDRGLIVGTELDATTCGRRHTIRHLTPDGYDELTRLQVTERNRMNR